MTAQGKITTSQAAQRLPRILVTTDRERGVATSHRPDGALFAAGLKTNSQPAQVVAAQAVAPQRGERNRRWDLVVELADGTSGRICGLSPSQTLLLAAD